VIFLRVEVRAYAALYKKNLLAALMDVAGLIMRTVVQHDAEELSDFHACRKTEKDALKRDSTVMCNVGLETFLFFQPLAETLDLGFNLSFQLPPSF